MDIMNDRKLYSILCLKDLSNCYMEILIKIPEEKRYDDIRGELLTIFNTGHNNILLAGDLKAVSHAYIQACYEIKFFWQKTYPTLYIENNEILSQSSSKIELPTNIANRSFKLNNKDKVKNSISDIFFSEKELKQLSEIKTPSEKQNIDNEVNFSNNLNSNSKNDAEHLYQFGKGVTWTFNTDWSQNNNLTNQKENTPTISYFKGDSTKHYKDLLSQYKK